jgi:hypothetical protein
MNEQKIEGLKNALRQVVELILARNTPLSEEIKSMLIQVMEHVANRIQDLRQQGSVEGLQPQKSPEVPASPFESSNINGMKYDPKSQELLVQFHGPYPQAAGSVYSYSGVPKFIFDVLEKGAIGPKTSGKNRYHQWIKGLTPSLGGTLNALIKAGGFQYQKLA